MNHREHEGHRGLRENTMALGTTALGPPKALPKKLFLCALCVLSG
jgi:hypothetical protein